jgi:predicted nucleotidyltransferase
MNITQYPLTLTPILKKLKNYLQTTYPNQLDQIILFGSQARNEAQPDSDIDILIILKNTFNDLQETQKISQFISELCLEHNTVITCFFTHSDLWNTGNNAFFRNIRQEGINL